ncbi:unnamed protein product [Rotaria magnacalcarata]|uniref:ABC transporter domain-containing protein n=2 Tax=Rotaria magnacalcarata TaxID=392030 RepID=A0A816XXT2_9BILA|nr:unnamed protein product [Rotaria magnacalcarata]CAF2233889.1 unnamed protein product [Rotaria magnacalcarata]
METIHNTRTVKQLTIEKELFQKQAKLIAQCFDIQQKFVVLSGFVFSLKWAVKYFAMATMYAVARVLIKDKEMERQQLSMIFAFAIFSMDSLVIVANLAKDFGSSISAVKRFFALFDRTPTIDNESTLGKELLDFRGEIEFNQVYFAYPTRPTSGILNNFRLLVKPGQRVALVGPSGCGKSTVIQLLERFYDVNRGQLLFDGIDIRELNIQWIRSQLGLVSQEPVLFDLTIAENITYNLKNVPFEDIIDAATQANIHDFILRLPQGYETKVGLTGSKMSGGEKQRIAIARVLVRRTKVLLLDEVTSAMDSHNEHIVQQTLERVQTSDATRTSIIIAHRLSTIRSCDLICLIDEGRIVESGTHTELIQKLGAYYHLFSQYAEQI